MSASHKRSAIWDYFVTTSLKDKAKCALCSTIYSYKGGSVSNLKKHLTSKHPTIIFDKSQQHTQHEQATTSSGVPNSGKEDEAEQSTTPKLIHVSKKPKLQTFLGSFASRPITPSKQQKINDLILNMLIIDVQPFSMIEDAGFRKLILELEPSYKFPSKKTFSQSLLPKKYEDVKDALRVLLEEADYINITTDGWTSIANESYISVTVHFISKDWIFYSCLLDCFVDQQSHTAKNVCDQIQIIIRQWGLSGKIYAATTDNAPNVVNSIQIAGWAQIPCFAHTLNLIVQKSLKEIDVTRKKVKSIVEYFHRSTQANIKFFSIQKQINPGSTPLKLKNDVVTRWNSTLCMFERILKLEESLTVTIGLLHNPVPSLTETEWKNIKESFKVLIPFEQVATEMSSEKTVTLSKVINIVRGLNSILHKFKDTISQDASLKLINSLMQGLSNRFANIETNNTTSNAALLDPRFKDRAFSTPELAKRAIENIQDEVVQLINKKTEQNPESRLESHSNSFTEGDTTANVCEDTDDGADLVWKDFDRQVKNISVQTSLSQAILELRMYMEDAPISRKEDPLQYWKTRQLIYPNLSVLAKRYLGIVATSVPSERIFSKAGEIVSRKRRSIKGKNVQSFLFLNVNSTIKSSQTFD